MGDLKGAELISANTTRRLIIRIGALEKNGKTTWSLTAPAPIAYFDLNNRAEHVMDRFVGRGIYRYEYDKFQANDKDGYMAIWTKFQKNWQEAVESPTIRTLIIDTDNDLWEIRRMAQWGRESSVPDQYGALNKDMRNLYDAVLSTDKNLVVISEKRKKYITKKVMTKNGLRDSSEWDGSYEFGGWSGTGFKVQINAEIAYNEQTKTFAVYVLNCGLNPFIAGNVYEGPECNFPCLAVDVFPDTDHESWGYDEYVIALGEEGGE